MRERRKINGSNGSRLCDLTSALVKVKILCHVIILLSQLTNLLDRSTDFPFSLINIGFNTSKLIWVENNYSTFVVTYCTFTENEITTSWCLNVAYTVIFLLFTLSFPVSLGLSYSYTEGQAGDEDATVDVKLYSHRWRRWVPPKPRNMDSNRASQEQDQDPEQEDPEGFPGLLSAEETDNSSQIEVGDDSHQGCATDQR